MPALWATGSSSGGFTLLEVLVVLAIVTLISVSVPVALPHLVPRQQLRVDAQSLNTSLREVRSESITANRVIALDLTTAGALLDRRQGTDIWKPSRGVAVTASPMARDGFRLVFFPDGSSSGGQFSLEFDHRRATVEVSPLTGRVGTDEP